MRLAQVVLERNVRSVLVDLSGGFQEAVWRELLPALNKGGYKLGVHLPPSTTLDVDFSSTEQLSTVDFVSKATEELKIPLTRTLLVKPSGNGHVVQIDQEELPTQYSSPQSLVQELLGFEHCLDPKWRAFGPHPIRMSEVFYESKHALGLVNLKPIVPGHVLIIPKRRIDRFILLDSDEVSDLWQSAQTVAKCLEPYFKAQSFTFSIQDGKAAGQTVPHVHVHVLPRKPGDFKKNDDVYEELDKNDQRRQLNLDENRIARTLDDMAAEAAIFRELCKQ